LRVSGRLKSTVKHDIRELGKRVSTCFFAPEFAFWVAMIASALNCYWR